MRNLGIASLLALLGVSLAGEFMVPDITEMPGARKILLAFHGGEDAKAFVAKSIGGEEQRATRHPPSEGLDAYRLALVARTDKEGGILGFSFVTWKPAEERAEDEWPELKEVAGATARVRGAETLLFRRLEGTEDAKWALEIVSFRRIEPEDDDEAIVRAKKEVLEEGGARLVEDRRFTLVAPAAPTDRSLCGVLLAPVWKEPGKILDGYDVQLVTTPAPTPRERE